MHRCALNRRALLLGGLFATLAICAAAPARAQAPRVFPATALRGVIEVTAPPEILLNGQPSRLSPGSRIRGSNNMMQLSGTLVGQKLLVNYTLDPLGQPHDVWVLREDEAARKPWPRTTEEAQTWSFDPSAQTWTKP